MRPCISLYLVLNEDDVRLDWLAFGRSVKRSYDGIPLLAGLEVPARYLLKIVEVCLANVV